MKKRERAYDGVNVAWEQRSVRSRQATFGEVRYQPGGYCGPRIQRDYQLVLLYSGSCDLRIGGSARALKVGNVYLLKPGHKERFLFDSGRQTHHFWCAVAPGRLSPALRAALSRAPQEGQPPSECFSRLVSAAFLLRPRRSAAAERVVDALAPALFSEFLNMADHASQMSRDDGCVLRALRHMEDHLAAPDCLASAQRAAGCSVNALIYKFSAAVGATPARHLWRLRTERGLGLLADTGLSIAEIADQCGFKNPFHFSRCVKRLQSKSPREIRRLAWA